MNRLVRLAEWLAWLVPAAAVLYLVLRYGVNVPYWDQWDLIPSFVALADGSLRWSDLLAQHNEHRIFFPRLVMLALGVLTRWNVVAEMLLGVALAVANLLVLAALARPVLRLAGTAARLWAAFTVSVMVFSFTQWENWLWGWQIQWFLAVLAAISSVALATGSLRSARPWAHVSGAAAAAVVCQFSIASGAAVWVVAGLVLACHRDRRRILPVWVLGAVVVTGLYLIGYVRPPHHPSPLVVLDRPGTFLLYFTYYLSGPLGRTAMIGVAALVAFAGLAAIAFARHRREPELVVPWIAIAAFAGANAVLTGIGRVGFGADQGLSSRYVTIALLLSVTLVPLGILALRGWPWGRWSGLGVQVGAASLLTGLVIAGDVRGLRGFVDNNRQMTIARNCVLDVEAATDDCLKMLFPDPSTVRTRTTQLHRLHWSGFPAGDVWTTPDVSLTGPTGARSFHLYPEGGPFGWLDTATVERGGLTVTGWARHPRGNLGVLRRVLVVADGAIIGEAEVTGTRPDVAAHFGDPDLARTGWMLQIRDFPADGGERRLKAYLMFADDVLIPLAGEATISAKR